MKPSLLVIPILQALITIGTLVGFVYFTRKAVLAVLRLLDRSSKK
jgi:hypothetical protein